MRIQWIVGAAAALAVTAGAQLARGGDGTEVTERLGFMAGCWQGRADGGIIDERWTPAANIMLGATRYLSEGQVTGYEFAVIALDGGETVMTPYPGGVRSEHGFRLERGTGERAVFSAPEHDFPKRIHYGPAGDSLFVRIDGGEGSDQADEWTMGRVDCDPRE
jgi:hypothetical protein